MSVESFEAQERLNEVEKRRGRFLMGGNEWQFPSNGELGSGDLLNWMLITSYEITGGFSGSKMVQFGNPSGSVALPIPPGIQAAYEQNWGQTTVPKTGQAFTRAAGFGSKGGITGWVRDFLGVASPNSGADQGNAIDWGAEGLAGVLTKAGAAEVAQFSIGARALDQIMMSYAGPAFRNFNYTFSFKPNNEEDSYQVNGLINWLKYKSSPEASNTAFSRLYKLPHVFKIEYKNRNDDHKRLPRIGHCALTNLSTNYGGDIFRTFDDDDHSPVQVDLTLAFKEMQLLDRNDFTWTQGAF